MKNPKDRVHGPGPGRKQLKTFAKLSTVPMDIVMKLKALAESEKRNDLGGDNYTLPSNFNLAGTFNAVPTKYRQVLFQTSPVQDPESEVQYSNWEAGFEDVQLFLEAYFKRVYRFRLSVMNPYHEIPWHIDTDTSVSCRAQICLNNGGSVFRWNTKSGIQELRMNVGDLYFINTGWSHSVQGGPGVRQVAIFGFQFNEATEQIQDKIWA